MANLIRRWLGRDSGPQPSPPTPLTTERIDAGYRLFWLKTALEWDTDRRTMIAERVAAAITEPGFAANGLERRFRVAGLDDQAHSGASLLALAAALRGLDDFDDEAEAP
ncbi:MAG: hypothetical protein GYB65_13865 [Chloroflexi bacterium]|nr:hypothetical protein [Chloroflexota bacterium]